MKPPFSVTQAEIEKPGKRFLGNGPTNLYLKFHELLSTNVGDIREKHLFLHEASFFHDAACNWETGKEVYGQHVCDISKKKKKIIT